MLNFKICFLALFCMIIFSSDNVLAKDCSYWNNVVGVENVTYSGDKINEKDPKQIIEGIGCLLKLEGIKTRGSISGATHNQVSQQLPQATVEITALHYISYLFYERFDYANGVALHEEENPEVLNSDDVIERAYIHYRKWYKKVKKIGLSKAREKKLNPLEGSGITWY